MKRLLTYSLLLWTAGLSAQELNCSVTINSDKVEGTNKQVFATLQQSVSEFINTQRFTDMTFADRERIECSMLIIVTSATTDGLMKCEMQVQSKRPVYNTSYQTPLINYRDNDFYFHYQEFDRIEFIPSQFTTNLAALLAYYCYLIIGTDMDSYSRLGGTPYYQMCENIVTMAQGASLEQGEQDGWKAMSSKKTRYALINNLMDEAFHPYREFIYTYHRLGLDEMAQNVANARARIAEEIGVLREANRARPGAYVVYTFTDAKNDEIAQLFEKGTADEKKKVYDVMMAIDPTRQSVYDRINK